jgi:uncharacterized protein YneF (UPF0154 family)
MELATALLYFVIVIAIVVFLIGVFLARWYSKKKTWDDSFKIAAILNLPWFVVNLVLGLALISIVPSITASIIALVINLAVGTPIAMKSYNKCFSESILFVAVVLIIEFIIVAVIDLLILFVLAMI